MAKFCGKCGSRLDETFKLCPNCDADQIKAQRDLLTAANTVETKMEESPISLDVAAVKQAEPVKPTETPTVKAPERVNVPKVRPVPPAAPVQTVRTSPAEKMSVTTAAVNTNATAPKPEQPLTKREKKAAKKAAKKAEKKAKKASVSLGRKILRFFVKLFLILLLLIIIAGAAVLVLSYYNILNIPYVDDFTEEYLPLIATNSVSEVERDIPDIDTKGFTYYQTSENDIITDSETGFTFVDNELLITLKSSSYKATLASRLKEKGGTIVGELPLVAEYQVQFSRKYTYAQLTDLMNELKNDYNWISKVEINYAMQGKSFQYIPNDEKWIDKWEDTPSGTNWGLEAIDAPGAWDYKDKMDTVNIGIIDDMFYLKHEDLVFAETPLGMAKMDIAIKNKEIKWSSHGTHVAGTMAATFDNGKGISGIATSNNLYGVSFDSLNSSDYGYGYDTVQMYKVAFYYLIVSKNCSVVNCSFGNNLMAFNASRGDSFAMDWLSTYSKGIGDFLELLINNGYNSFVICTSAGNQSKNAESMKLNKNYNYLYFEKDNDDNFPYKYYNYQDYLDYLEGNGWYYGNNGYDYLERYKKRNDEIKNRLVGGNVDANYDELNFINNNIVKDRIIVVGAIKNKNILSRAVNNLFNIDSEQYKIADFSNCGSRVDVVAPGVDIYSTVKKGYAKYEGTSQASPHVAGVAALVFSVNPDLSGKDVKDIICSTTVGSYGNEGYGLVNAKNAVEKALNYTPTEDVDDLVVEDRTLDLDKLPEGRVEFNGHYYYIYDLEEIVSATDAIAYCEEQQGYMATVTSPEENEFLFNYMKSLGYESAYFGFTCAGKGQWIESEHQLLPKYILTRIWKWINGETVSYVNWHEGEPNEENLGDYAMFYDKYDDGTWNGGNFGANTANGGTAFICEWGDYEIDSESETETESELESEPEIEVVRTTSDERDIVLTLDLSSSMNGTPIAETQNASTKFIDTILNEDASIGLVGYNSSATMLSDFSVDKNYLKQMVSSLGTSGRTNMEAGLSTAYSMLNNSNAKKKIIVLMSDGEPNIGKDGDDLIAYADEIKASGVIIYTLGFFESMSGSKSSAQILMERIASEGCHYEVASADDLVFFFNDVANQINGQRYIYIKIACPVDVSVTYNGETLNSSSDNLNTRTDFGTLSFEEDYEKTNGSSNDQMKILRLKEGTDYDIKILGTGRGLMNYTIGFMDENGDYNDFRTFENVKITKNTMIDTVADTSNETVLKVDQDGDNKYDVIYKAAQNQTGVEVKPNIFMDNLVFIIVAGVIVLFLFFIVIKMKKRAKRKAEI